MKHLAAVSLVLIAFAGIAGAQTCDAPELICKAAANQDRSLYFRDHCRYEQKIHVERYKLKGDKESVEELRDTTVIVEPAKKPDKTGDVPVLVRVIADTDKKGNPKDNVKENEATLLSFGAVWDVAFFPLLPERVRFYNFKRWSPIEERAMVSFCPQG
jgi:hypothetical protein